MAASGVSHVGANRIDWTFFVFQWLLTILGAAIINGLLQGNNLALLLIVVGVVTFDTNTAITEAAGIGFAILERRVEHLFAFLNEGLVRREFLNGFPVITRYFMNGIYAIGKFFKRYVRKTLHVIPPEDFQVFLWTRLTD